MIEKKNSTDRDSHEERQTDGQKKTRGKTTSRSPPIRSKRELSGVEEVVDNDVSTKLADDSTSPREEIETPGRLTRAQIAAIQYDYKHGFTVDQIHLVTGNGRATIYKYIKNIEVDPSFRPEDEVVNHASPTPPQSSLSQPIPAAQPPRIIEVSDQEVTEETKSDPEQDGKGYGTYGPYLHESRRLPLPVVDQQAITELILLFGSDMRRKGYTNFLDYFEQFVIPRFEELEFWESHVPGDNPGEKRHNLVRYLWIAGKYFQLQKEHAEYEAANNGTGLKEGS